MLIVFKVDFSTKMNDLTPKERKILGRLRGMADLNRRICLRLIPKDPDPGDWITTAEEVEDWSELPDP